MDIVPPFVTDSEPSVAVEPAERTLNHPTIFSKVSVFLAAFFNVRVNASVAQIVAKIFRVVGLVPSQRIRPLARTSLRPLNGGNGFDRGQGFFDVMDVGCAQANCNRNSLFIRDKVAFSPRFGTVRRVRAGFGPPFGAGTLEASMRNFFQSICSSLPSSLRKVSWSFFQIPSLCHVASRRHALIPEPQPISWGKSSQGIPVFRTNTIAVKASRLGIGGRPFEPLGLSGGSNGSTFFHISSLIIFRAIGNLRVPYGYRLKLGFC